MQPIQERYKDILQRKEHRRKRLELEMAFEQALRDPEDINPSFRPDVGLSQETVSKSYDHGFDQFLREMNLWKVRKEKKLRDLKHQSTAQN
jgi:hypothetical protein